jgi:hypothetical protein
LGPLEIPTIETIEGSRMADPTRKSPLAIDAESYLRLLSNT